MKEFIVKEYETFPYKNAVNEMPELIRCKDCKYRNEYSYCTLYINWHHLTGDMDYCSDGERKEE